MNNYGFIRVAAATPEVKVADVQFNTEEIIRITEQAEAQKTALLVFPELSITGYTCGDLFTQNLLLDEAEKGIKRIKEFSRGKGVTIVVGTPVRYACRLYNCAVVIRNGMVYGIVPKTHLPNSGEFYEARWFSSGTDFLSVMNTSAGDLHNDGKNNLRKGMEAEITFAGGKTTLNPNQIFSIGNSSFAIEICEDLWTPLPPSTWHTLAGADIIANLSASNEVLLKHNYRKQLTGNLSARTGSAYIYASSGFGESTQDLVYAGASMIFENGSLMAENSLFSLKSGLITADIDTERLQTLRRKSNTFSAVTPDGTESADFARYYNRVNLGKEPATDFEKELKRFVEPHPFVPGGDPAEIDRRAREIVNIQVTGLAQRLRHIGAKTAVIGISGGLDSTLALLVTVLAFDKLGWSREGILGITMPGFGTTDRTYGNALDLMSTLSVSRKEISIVPAVKVHFSDIGQNPEVHDVTYENSQARERTQILMDIANKVGGIVVGTGDLSELALGWATYNGDHMSMYGVNSGIPKTLVKYLVKWAAENQFTGAAASGRSVRDILLDIADTPISPELTPADENGNIKQKTEDLVGPYELHDFYLYNFFRFGYSPEKILFLAKKAFITQESTGLFAGPEGRAEEYDEAVLRKWLKKFIRRFFSQQFKRSCLPDGPKVGSVSLSPRGDWRMPSDASATLWASFSEEN